MSNPDSKIVFAVIQDELMKHIYEIGVIEEEKRKKSAPVRYIISAIIFIIALALFSEASAGAGIMVLLLGIVLLFPSSNKRELKNIEETLIYEIYSKMTEEPDADVGDITKKVLDKHLGGA